MQLQTALLSSLQSSPPVWDSPLDPAMDSDSTLVLAFGSPAAIEHPAVLEDIGARYPRSVVLGCSTAGEIAGRQVHDGSLSLAVARFEHTQLKSANATVTRSSDSRDAGVALGQTLNGNGLKAVFLLSDGLNVNGTLLIEGLRTTLPEHVTISGGLAGDGTAFRNTWVFDGHEAKQGRVCAVGFYGDRLNIGHGCDHGWVEFGPSRRITRAEGNVLYELDGKPALELYKTYLGELAQGLPGTALLFPLAVWNSEHDPQHLVRTILAVDEEAQSMTFAGTIPEGGYARLMRSNNENLIDSAGKAAGAAARGAGAGASLVVSVSCVGRRLVLGERTDEEIETVQEAAPSKAGHVGFYSYGEISPAIDGRFSELHNQTMTVTVISER